MTARTDRKISLGFSGGLILFAVTALLALAAMQRVVSDTAWVAHTYEVRRELRNLNFEYAEAKSDSRTFLLTGDSSFLARANLALANARVTYGGLLRLTSDNPSQQERLRALEPLIAEREAALAAVNRIGPLQPRGLAGDTLRARLQRGEAAAAQVSNAIAAMTQVEQRLLDARTNAQARNERYVRYILAVLAAIGAIVAWVVRRSVSRDLRARARAEAALRESEAKYAGIISLAGDAIITIDEAQRIRLFNRGAERVFGYAEEDVLGKRLEILLPESAAPRHRALVARFAESPESARRMGERREIAGRRRNGAEFPADASISKLDTPDGRLFTVVLRDMTEQRRIARYEHVLAETGRALADTLDYESMLRAVAAIGVPALGDWAIVDVVEEDEGGRSVYHRVVSTHPDPAIDAALRVLESLKLSQDSPSRVLDVIRTGRAELIEVDEEWLEAHTDPETFPASVAAGPRWLMIVPLTVSQHVLGTITIARRSQGPPLDSSDLALATEVAARAAMAIENARNFRRAQLATRARDEVLNVVSHDLRNPLAAIAMSARTLLEHPGAGETERRRLYRSTIDAVDWMQRMVQDLLDAASIDAGRLSVEIEPQSVPALLDSVVEMFELRSEAEGVQVVAQCDPAMPLVNADPARILQVLANLVGNALKYTRAHGRVTIGAEQHGDEVHVFVRDTGAGIAPENLPRLFDRFWTLRGASRTPGTGLGLAIAKGIVAAHGGRIWAESVLGEGSTFWFTLPVTVRSPMLPPPPSRAAAPVIAAG